MEDYIAFADIGPGKTIHIASLARQTVIDAGAEHMGFEGYFVFEVDDTAPTRPLSILAKVTSIESAFRMADLWAARAAT